MTTKTKNYFVNETGENYPVISGRYGAYCRQGRINYSEKEMAELGYKIESLTANQVAEYDAKYAAWQKEQREHFQRIEMEKREKDVDICLNSTPLEIGEGNDLWNHITNVSEEMGGAYHGCGKGTAYIRDGKIIAFHNGYNRPANAPEAEAIQVEFSCYQILF